MKTHRLIYLFSTLLLLCLSGSSFAYEEQIIEEENEYGGKTTQYRDIDGGISEGVIFYGNDDEMVREEIIYTNLSISLYGIKRINRGYFFGKKVREDIFYSSQYARKYSKIKAIQHFDRYSGERVKLEQFFSDLHLGNSVIHFQKGIRSKVEWIYSDVHEGVKHSITHYDPTGKKETRVEYLYADRTVRKQGFYKSEYFIEQNKKIKEIWYFTEDFEGKNNGVYKKIVHYRYYPQRTATTRTHYFDREDNLLLTE